MINGTDILLTIPDYLYSIPLIQNHHKIIESKMPIDLMIPIKYGQKEVVEYLITNYECNKTNICSYAALYNQFDILKWAYDVNSPHNWSICTNAAKVVILKF